MTVFMAAQCRSRSYPDTLRKSTIRHRLRSVVRKRKLGFHALIWRPRRCCCALALSAIQRMSLQFESKISTLSRTREPAALRSSERRMHVEKTQLLPKPFEVVKSCRWLATIERRIQSKRTTKGLRPRGCRHFLITSPKSDFIIELGQCTNKHIGHEGEQPGSDRTWHTENGSNSGSHTI